MKATIRAAQSIAVLAMLTMVLGTSHNAAGQAAVRASVIEGPSGARFVQQNTPAFVRTARDMGAANSEAPMRVRVWLKLHNASSLDALVRQQYQEGSPKYHQWLTKGELTANFAPTADDAATVEKYLTGRNLAIANQSTNHLYVDAEGKLGDVQAAFGVQIHNFMVAGKMRRANTADPTIEDAAGGLVAAISGLADTEFEPHVRRPVDANGDAYPFIPLAQAKATPDGLFFSAGCFRPAEAKIFMTSGALPKAAYFGNRYGADITNTVLGTLPPCGYAPSELQTAYKLKGLYSAGLTGAGQTIAIVDAYGSPTIAQDAELFSQVYGLPDLTPSNFQIVGTPTPPPTAALQSWVLETTLDVEWAHAVAPGANIVLIIAPTSGLGDLVDGIIAGVENGYGNVISNSWGDPETLLSPAIFQAIDSVLEAADAEGISVHFSSGDDGDYAAALGYTDVSYPASSIFATGVGGTSVALNKNDSLEFQTGWGNNISLIAGPAATGSQPVVPPVIGGFEWGAGGGASGFYAKPKFQRQVPGEMRGVPDISYDADPDTGVEIVITLGGEVEVGVVGGTSLAAPMFSGIWAIANQQAGAPLGQAAPLLYRASTGAVTDISPFLSFTDVSGVIQTKQGFSYAAPWELAAPLGSTRLFYSALFQDPGTTAWFVLSFGTDSSLATTPGWDNVTGLGTPNGLAFVRAVTKTK
ncbi:MAG: S53 family peptidase [Candidatus Acidiferrales bacterium]